MNMELHEERETRRIILLRGKNPKVLIGFDGAHCTLPQVETPRWQRVAENLTAALTETCGINAVSVSSLETSPADSASRQNRYEIMEPCAPDAEAPRGKEWVAVDCLIESAFRDACDVQAVRQAIAQTMAYAEDTSRGPFGRLGWFPDLQHWVQEQIGTQGLYLNGRFRQLNACPTFSLIRFETDGPAVWFKAVGDPNQREYPLTFALARSFPRFLPQIIATRRESNGWLAREAEGPLLHECSGLASWEAAAADLAELQIHSLGRSLQFLDPGARDLRTWALADLVEPFFRTIGDAMERQTKTPPPGPLPPTASFSGRNSERRSHGSGRDRHPHNPRTPGHESRKHRLLSHLLRVSRLGGGVRRTSLPHFRIPAGTFPANLRTERLTGDAVCGSLYLPVARVCFGK